MRQQTFLRFACVLAAAVAVAGCGRTELEVPDDVPSFDVPGDVRPDVPPDVPVTCTTSAQCDDNVFCNGVEQCVAGLCRPGTPVVCDDRVDCTDDACNEMTRSCMSTPNDMRCPATNPPSRCDVARGCVNTGCTSNSECDDGDVCNGVEMCRAGFCVRNPPPRCDDGIPCTRDTCVPRVGCQNVADNLLCDDGVFCNGAEVCNVMAGGCLPAMPVRCEDGNPCTDDRCDEATHACTSRPTDADGDGFPPARCGGRDCDDTNARINPGAREVCNDRIDNNCDGRADCADAMCAMDPMCLPCMPTGPEATPTACSDGRDNDCNGLVDCADAPCRAIPDFCMVCVPTGPEVCTDGRDNDCNGFADCADVACVTAPSCCMRTGPENTPVACTDGRDNDCNGLTDCRDPGCAMVPPCVTCVPTGPEVCNDGRDNDCNGTTDCADRACTANPLCTTVPNDNCTSPTTIGVPGRATGSTASAHDDFTPSCRPGGAAPDVVYVFRNPVRQTIVVDTIGSSYDTVLTVRRDCTAGPDIACDDDSGGGLTSRIVLTNAEPGTYFVIVDGFASFSGPYVLNISTIATGEVCNNMVDDDGDGLVDCADPDCAMSPFCIPCMPTGPENNPLACGDMRDNDCDGLVDCLDPDCRVVPRCAICMPAPENTNVACTDGRDNDCDGLTDCADPDCAGLLVCPCRPTGPENNALACGDGRDNDCDGLVDCRDPDCAAVPACMVCVPTPENNPIACGDGRDNDCDGRVDCADADCSGVGTCACIVSPEVCTDGRDNDCDRLVDCMDPDCATNPACMPCMPTGAENTDAACGDMRDNDCDTLIDCADPDCAAVARCRVCVPSPENTEAACSDGRDNDCDTLTDCADPNCAFTMTCGACTPTGPENTDAACRDGRDNDCNRLVDCADPGCRMLPACLTPPPNDTCAGPITVGVPSVTMGTTGGAANDFMPTTGPGFPGCAGGAGPDVVYTFTVSATTPMTISLVGAGLWDTVLYVRRDTCTTGAQVACNDDSMGTLTSQVALVATPGTYYVFADGFSPASQGSFTLTIALGTPPENCTNMRDDDGDGLVDCMDPDCRTDPACMGCVPTGPENTVATCTDGRDNNCNRLTDCADPGCAAIPACCRPTGPENTAIACRDGRDNDCNGLIDCADPGCRSMPVCCVFTGPENTAAVCADGRDNDCDGLIDCTDPDCALTTSCCRPTGRENTAIACTDGRDNDCDGSIDCADADCAGLLVCCRPTPEICTDGRDNDCDGLIDCADPSCATDPACRMCVPTAMSEGGVAACTDGVDNDCDGQTDCADSDCTPFPGMGSECCNGRDDNGNTLIDEFACRCVTSTQCAGVGAGGRFPSTACYSSTRGVCGPPCTMIGGNLFCNAFSPGTTCDMASGECR